MIIPLPKYTEPEPTVGEPASQSITEGQAEWIKWYLDVPNWICPVCQATMFGRMKYCVYCKARFNRDTIAPPTHHNSTALVNATRHRLLLANHLLRE